MSALFVVFILGMAVGGTIVVATMLAFQEWERRKGMKVPTEWHGIHEDR